ncbi:MAG: DUF1015 domain-containing protein [Candidatus Bathyarchaeales archaeon]
MVDIRPFKAITYTSKAGALQDLITQPYDKIDAAMQREYYAKSPYNYCRLILPIEENKYTAARKRIQNWLNNGILAKDPEPAFYIARQTFTFEGKRLTRTGLIAALRLYSYEEKTVFPHEITYHEPKTDRLNMLRAVQKNLEPIFLIYSDPENVTTSLFAEATKTAPTIDVKDQLGVTHTVWKIADAKSLEFLRKTMENKKLVITDGHHRYESALAHRDEMRKHGTWTEDSAFNFHMAYIVPVQDPGLIILPTHRLLRNIELTSSTLTALKRYFAITEIPPTATAIENFLATHNSKHAIAIYDGAKAHGLILKDETAVATLANADCTDKACLADVAILHDIIFKQIMKITALKMDENITYAETTRNAVGKVDSGQANIAFILNPIKPETVWHIAQNGRRLPEKSTNFHPKPASGLMMMDITPNEKL